MLAFTNVLSLVSTTSQKALYTWLVYMPLRKLHLMAVTARVTKAVCLAICDSRFGRLHAWHLPGHCVTTQRVSSSTVHTAQ